MVNALGLALALALALSGCIFSGGPDDIAIVCEREAASPSHPYAPDDIKAQTLVEPGLSADQVGAATKAIADRVLTFSGAPYDAFEGHLYPASNGTWSFDANGTYLNDTDRYHIDLAEGNGSLQPTNSTIVVPARIVDRAMLIVGNDTEALRSVSGHDVTSATWTKDSPSCVSLVYDNGKRVDVNVVDLRVVHLS